MRPLYGLLHGASILQWFLLTCNLGHITQNERDKWYVRILLTHDAVVNFRTTYQDLGSPTDALKTANCPQIIEQSIYFINISSAITVVGLICQFRIFNVF